MHRALIDIHDPIERTFLVGAPRKGSADAARVDEHLDELGRLADTAGAEVVGRLIQRIEKPTSNLFLGEGKVEELKAEIAAAGGTLAMFDDPLTPAQGSNLEEALGVRVMDRAEVILDIFATRARSAEARMQVELAQLEYTLPRLMRMWTHLSRIRGGIGLRGPGETQLETDRRAIRRKISILRGRLEEVAAHRANQRQGRGERPSAALVGYTNAGKSSLLKALSGENVFVEDRLFATIDTLSREVDVGGGYRVRVTDTVGFIRKLPHHLVASFRATLEEAREADILVHVIDASHPLWEEQVEVVETVIEDMEVRAGSRERGAIDSGDQETMFVFNKADLLPDREAFLAQVSERYAPAVLASTIPQSPFPDLSIEPLRTLLHASAQSLRPLARIRVPLADGRLLAELHREAEVVGQEAVDGMMVVTARVEARLLGKLRRDGIDVTFGEQEAGSGEREQ
jgi:GTP-binding protein HflX